MKRLLIALLAASLFTACNSSSEESTETTEVDEAVAYSFDTANTTLTWTAFKTPEKVGVPGTFDDITLNGNSFTINTYSVNSGVPDRDAKIKNFFFGNLSDSLITGSYGTAANGVIPVTLKMNGVEKTFDFALTETDSTTEVSGTIDIISDFSGNAALEGIHEACKELHMGKTWSDVTLKVVQTK